MDQHDVGPGRRERLEPRPHALLARRPPDRGRPELRPRFRRQALERGVVEGAVVGVDDHRRRRERPGGEQRLERPGEERLAGAEEILLRRAAADPGAAAGRDDDEGDGRKGQGKLAPEGKRCLERRARAVNPGSGLTCLSRPRDHSGSKALGEPPMPLKLVVANKAYSSWSLRPWILLAHFKIPFEEVVIQMGRPETRETMLKYAPTGKCPSLHDGKIAVWESLAIMEYVAELYPEKAIWPQGQGGPRLRPVDRHRDAWRLSGAPAGAPDQFPPRAEGGCAERRRQERHRPDRGRLGACARTPSARRGRSCSDDFPRPTPCTPRWSTASTPTPSRSRQRRAPIWTRSWRSRRGRPGSPTAEAEPWRIDEYEAI